MKKRIKKTYQGMQVLLILLVSVVGLSGCLSGAIAASHLFVGATYGWGGYTIYKMNSGATASFEIERNDPNEKALSQIRQAKRVAIYPIEESGFINPQGEIIGIFRKKTDLTVVSSTETIRWVKGRKDAVAISEMPMDERYGVVSLLGEDTKADMVLYVSVSGPETDMTPLMASRTITTPLKTYLVDVQSGEVLWSESQKIVIGGGLSSMPSSDELSAVMIAGIADRIMELRTGQQPEQKEDEPGMFECGGRFRPDIGCDEAEASL